MKILFTCLFFSCTVLGIHAQSSYTYNELFPLNTPEITLPEISNRYFYDDLFHKGELRTSYMRFKEEYTYRYDKLERTIEAKKTDGTTILVDESTIVWCKLFLDKQVVTFVAATVPNKWNKSLLQLVYQSPTMQVLRDFDNSKIERTYPTSANPVHVLKSQSHYFINNGGNKPYKEVEITAKSFSDAFPNHVQYIKQLFKTYDEKELTMSKLVILLRKLDNRMTENN